MDLEKRLARYEDLHDLWVNMRKFKQSLRLDPKTGCYIWTGNLHRQGYGMVGAIRKSDMKRIMTVVHRVVMRQILKRGLSFNEDVSHTCGNVACCNPKHLKMRETRVLEHDTV